MAATEHALTLTQAAAQAAVNKKGAQLAAFDVSERLAITDVFLIITATNERQVGAVVDGIEEELLKIGAKTVRREGDRENRWVLMDYLDMVVHVQHKEERALYSLERLWRDCPAIELHVDVPEATAEPTAELGADDDVE
ncbi:MAG: ribosome silencing factor [Propionibacteriaceae bacterium]|jgi:ribosome-associated protein|nr:ribosome silencing factor [Micropruina sp.]HBX81679.1 ribosome silencing factor [Propionibacteriaceae bacterium]HBY23225.1 ribosome silencing factor [Propionibacteriaceae bacterium]